jgi:ankyrin repeat protein
MHPGSINMMDNEEHNCLHILLRYCAENFQDNDFNERVIEFAGFLLSKAPGLISSANRDGDLPLHLACMVGQPLSVVRFVYNAHPEALYLRNNAGNTPLDEARASDDYDDEDEREEVVSFFQYQFEFLTEAGQDWLPDGNGQLPINRQF